MAKSPSAQPSLPISEEESRSELSAAQVDIHQLERRREQTYLAFVESSTAGDRSAAASASTTLGEIDVQLALLRMQHIRLNEHVAFLESQRGAFQRQEMARTLPGDEALLSQICKTVEPLRKEIGKTVAHLLELAGTWEATTRNVDVNVGKVDHKRSALGQENWPRPNMEFGNIEVAPGVTVDMTLQDLIPMPKRTPGVHKLKRFRKLKGLLEVAKRNGHAH
jgi:hypothetical protein